MNKSKSLTLNQLSMIDALITRAQTIGVRPAEKFKTHITADQATATPDAHHPLFDLSVRDRTILTQIRQLSSQLGHSTSVNDLMKLRAQAVKTLNRQ